MKATTKTYGFGVDPQQNQIHFWVITPPDKKANILIYERPRWTLTADGVPLDIASQTVDETDHSRQLLRLEFDRRKWESVRPYLTQEFNARLAQAGMKRTHFMKGGTPVEKQFGQEMMVLLWATEDAEPDNIPTAVRNWKGLMPEERWWLYTMTNASTGGKDDKRGWRIALRYALCGNPISKSTAPHRIYEQQQLPIDKPSAPAGGDTAPDDAKEVAK